MTETKRQVLALTLGAVSVAFLAPPSHGSAMLQQSQEATGQSSAARRIGNIKAINGTSITLGLDSGPEVNVALQDTTHILRIAPGEKTLKNATPIQLQDLQVGDRILAVGKMSEDGRSVVASSVLVMKRSDVDARQEQELQDWQKRGASGLVTSLDPTMGTITISATSFAGSKSITVRTSKDTVIRRYAPDSVKFSDAKLSTLQEIHPGDQLRARGNRNADRTELTAEEIVSGRFPYVEGTINSIDANASTISVQDVLSKKTVVVKIAADSQLRQLPPEMAQRMAMRLKVAGAAAGAGLTGAAGGGSPGNGTAMRPDAEGTKAGGNGVGGGRNGAAPDLQQMLNRLPPATLADLHKGDAVLIVATEGRGSAEKTAINLYSGVDPILRAAPSGSEATILGAWSLGGPSGDAGNQ